MIMIRKQVRVFLNKGPSPTLQSQLMVNLFYILHGQALAGQLYFMTEIPGTRLN